MSYSVRAKFGRYWVQAGTSARLIGDPVRGGLVAFKSKGDAEAHAEALNREEETAG